MSKKRSPKNVSFAALAKNKPFLIGVITFALLFILFIFKPVKQQIPSSPLPIAYDYSSPHPTSAAVQMSPLPSPIEVIPTPKPKIPTPTPSAVKGIDLSVHGVTFDAKPTTNGGGAYRYSVKNGGNVTLENDRHADHFETLVTYANTGTDEARDIKIEYYVDNTKITEGKTYIPGGMFNSDTAVPVKIPSSGTHTVRIEIDPEKKLSDVNYANNTFTFTYTVR